MLPDAFGKFELAGKDVVGPSAGPQPGDGVGFDRADLVAAQFQAGEKDRVVLPDALAEDAQEVEGGGLVLGQEDSASRMNRLGRSELNYGEYRTISSTLADIDGVTLEDVNAVARQILTKPFGAAVLGPRRPKRSLPQPLRSIPELAG